MTSSERYKQLRDKLTRKGLTPDERWEFEARNKVEKEMRQNDAELQQERAELGQQARLLDVFRLARHEGKVLRDDTVAHRQHNEQAVLALANPGEEDKISGVWFNSIIAETPSIAKRFEWGLPPASKFDPTVEAQDRRTLEAAAKEYKTFSGSSAANLALARQILGPGFSTYDLLQEIRSGKLRLSAPSDAERQQWEQERIDQEQLRLRNLSTTELKTEVSSGFEQRRAAFRQAEASRVLEAKQQAEAEMNYPQIPEFYQGKRVDQKFFKQCSRSEMRWFLQRFGEFQVTQKIRGL